MDFDVQPFQMNDGRIQNYTNQVGCGQPYKPTIQLDYEHLCDLQILHELPCILPLLEFMHDLNNFNCTIINNFECDMVATIKLCNSDIYNGYCDPFSRFTINNFNAFNFLLEFQHESIHM